MIYKQCKFIDQMRIEDAKAYDGAPEYIDTLYLGGIAVCDEDYTDDETPILVGVICGCCGGFIEPDDIVEIKYFDDWIDIEECIRGDK